MQRWQYLTRTDLVGFTEADLDALGEDGWELAGVSAHHLTTKDDGVDVDTWDLIFKRPLG
jgi:hypothetical protein